MIKARWLAGLFLLLPALTAAQVELPRPTGPHPVGVQRFVWTDSTRDDLARPDQQVKRQVLVRLWYPAERRADARPAAYVPDLDDYIRVNALSAGSARVLAAVRQHAIADAPLAGRSLPLVVFSPGNGEREWMYTALLSELASHGYVCALVLHPGVSAAVFNGGTFVRRSTRLYDPKPQGWDSSITPATSISLSRALHDVYYTEAAQYLTADLTFVLDRITALNPVRFGNAIDLQRIVSFGHSYGGNIAMEVCAHDPRVRACMSMDGGSFVETRDRGLTRPHLLIRPAWENYGWPRGLAQHNLLGSAQADAWEANIVGANHRSFMDAQFLQPPPDSVLDPGRVLEITSAVTRAFLSRVLDGKAHPLLEGSTPYAEVFMRSLRVDPRARR